jgi:hypothetical protein
LLPFSPEPFVFSSAFKELENQNITYKTITLPMVLYRYKTWSLTLREEQRLSVFENRVLRKISGGKKDEMT